MKESVSLLSNLLLSSALFLGVPIVEAEEMISAIPTDMTAYCHPEFSTMSEDSLSWQLPVLDPSTATIVDFYSSCDYGLSGSEGIFFPPLGEDFQESSKTTNTSKPFSAILRRQS